MQEWAQIAVRSAAAITILFIITRILGKKQISQLTYFEYILGIALGEMVGFMSIDLESPFMYGLIGLLTWFLLPFILEIFALKSNRLRKWFEGTGTVFIKEGKIMEDNLKKERYTADELLEQLRIKSVFNVADVEFAMLEASGDLSILLKQEHQPLTPKQLGIRVAPQKETQAVIIDGNIMDEPLATAGLSREWLQTELEKIGVTLENVFVGQVESYGQLYVDLYDDMLKVPPMIQKPLLLATLKKCEADLALYGLSTANQDAKRMYEQCMEQLSGIIEQVEPFLKR
ncbi:MULTISPECIES: DUF421 domain-containing protein [unclassified Paenibacillus]|uniref:DUF421 domain-containing protein n=1 Tax=unclassified Paenibacillus TaxID=185978 RepID=UPI001AEA14A0|nr:MULTISPECIES: DUF421 domain-containing protein [unclassified Paenibacillus]MBP1156397.1 uncharacterized membrane protein YcaP (DUF421 family) [Paenibacillus sp. PvP091]MBP1168217.1 uncharacterized membrane protein YcaP (DUF421 family) [Paenibacillus sp. PvR098]MBP2439245.1 uncharacterized membrane protein YcaP (DUF421 family) [Paenibacillus sp. PvP052]